MKSNSLHSSWVGFILALYNLREMIKHDFSLEEINLIKSTQFFNFLDEKNFLQLLKTAKIHHYRDGEIILEPHQACHYLYIIAQGSVHVNAASLDHKNIPLTRLVKGQYFGEQALLNNQNASHIQFQIAEDDTKLILIDKRYFLEAMQRDKNLAENLKKAALKQIMSDLAKLIDIYQLIEAQFRDKLDVGTVEYLKDQVIFKSNETSDCVYFILEGSVKISDPKENTSADIILRQGHLFGELGIIQKTSRSRAAISCENTRLLKIAAAEFLALYESNTNLKKFMTVLRNTYCIPKRGKVEQCIGQFMGKETITTFYKLDDGRSIVASLATSSQFFVMYEETKKVANKKYTYEKNENNKIELNVLNNRILGVKCYGAIELPSSICACILDNKLIPNEILEKFYQTGKVVLNCCGGDSQNICECMGISKAQIEQNISEGCQSLAQISQKTGACTVCGSCRQRILEMLGQGIWINATISKAATHNSEVVSFYIQPTFETISSYIAGQHIIIQINIEDSWVERAYTLTDITADGKLRITVKNESGGKFSTWLFKNMDQPLPIYISPPQGLFTVSSIRPVICIAGGIGITPFISFAREHVKKNNPQKMHILYIASTTDDFILLEEFDALIAQSKDVSLQLWPKQKMGSIDKVVTNIISANPDPEVYICGPEGFELSIDQLLKNLHIQGEHIHIEKFSNANPII